MSVVRDPNPTDAARKHVACVEAMLLTLAYPETVVSALDTLDTLSERWQTDYDAVVKLDAELIPRRAAAGRSAVTIGPHTCTTAHRAGVIASWVLESMVCHALHAQEAYHMDSQRFLANLDVTKPFDYQFAKDCSGIIVRAARCWAIPEVKGLGVEIEYESALLTHLATSANARSEQPQGRSQTKSGKRGSPVKTDPRADKRLCQDWQAAKRQGMSRDAFARERGITVQALIEAQDREKYRRRRDAE